jgi:hypothetical protein
MRRPCANPAIYTLSAIAAGSFGALTAGAAALDVNEIVSRSVAAAQADWQAAPQFDFREHDIITKGGKRRVRTYQVLMIQGSTYHQLIAQNGKPLSPAETAVEEQKLRHEIQARSAESPAARARRIAQYQRERRQDHELMREMIKAFRFNLTGTETMNGRQCYRVEATPNPAYVPVNRDTRVLTGMRGTLWIDTGQYQWVKVTARVFRPVSFGLFIARVQPGTEFTLEQAPVSGSIWLPVHLVTHVNARVLAWSHNSIDDETYSEYRRERVTPGAPTPGPPAKLSAPGPVPR